MNPFRCLTQVLRQSTYLQHAVLALACHHIENSNSDDSASELSKPVFDHGQTALHLLRQTLSGQNIAQMSSSLLDTIMTLFSLDVSLRIMQTAILLTSCNRRLTHFSAIGRHI